ncbi:hypothetical protein FVE85_8245 [Porphyridium purpureum]|uniref:Uncharacterized protein n=1 Tax=Porphyridium purpureum TaxID=35688 RepID=A0A5J4YM75_PORPP|nr:hypothetical protein FVE85_8245 [Porphyridium purpureum]|eukprot:POR1993..scf244_11
MDSSDDEILMNRRAAKKRAVDGGSGRVANAASSPNGVKNGRDETSARRTEGAEVQGVPVPPNDASSSSEDQSSHRARDGAMENTDSRRMSRAQASGAVVQAAHGLLTGASDSSDDDKPLKARLPKPSLVRGQGENGAPARAQKLKNGKTTAASTTNVALAKLATSASDSLAKDARVDAVAESDSDFDSDVPLSRKKRPEKKMQRTDTIARAKLKSDSDSDVPLSRLQKTVRKTQKPGKAVEKNSVVAKERWDVSINPEPRLPPKVKKEAKAESRLVSTWESGNGTQDSQDRKKSGKVRKFEVEGQRYQTPDEDDPLRIFYSTMYAEKKEKQKDCTLALNWLTARGCVPDEK